MILNKSFLDSLFGADSTGNTIKERALSSKRVFVRALDQIAEDSPQARGRRLGAREVFETYGPEILHTIGVDGAAILCEHPFAARRVLRERRDTLNLSQLAVARAANVPPHLVEKAESSSRVPIREVEKIARVLGLDERFLSVQSEPVGNTHVAYRLRTVGQNRPSMTETDVAAISEAAWVAHTQVRLEEALGLQLNDYGIEQSPNYGEPGYPAYEHGYWLASETRRILNLGERQLPKMLRRICEEDLGIPIIQIELGDKIAGATLEVGKRRAIVVNTGGWNHHAYFRRSTLAHELGHILYDPPSHLQSLRVDDFSELDTAAESRPDYVEQRANAFGVEFLAPRNAVLECYESGGQDPVGEVMRTFGVTQTVARRQVWLALKREVPFDSITTKSREVNQEFEAGEAFSAWYHPLRNIRSSRSGRFSAIVTRAAEDSLISWDTAAEYLECTQEELLDSKEAIKELFPRVLS